jgi:hypothetical protein
MNNTSFIRLRLNKAYRNLKDFLKVTYMTGAIGDDDQRYISIWEDYKVAREILLKIDFNFFSSLDDLQFPKLKETESFAKKETFLGYPAHSRDIIKAALDNALNYIDQYELDKQSTNPKSDEVTESSALIIRIMNNWSNMISSFKDPRSGVTQIHIKNEYDMQYLLEGVLRLFFADVRPETYTPNYANKSNRTDFLLPKERILIETKMTRPGLDTRKLTEELIVDKEHYRKHHGIDIILCLVYDPERKIKNPEGLKDIQELVVPPFFNVQIAH